jgi:glycosyltransferase involved in cell wall biosynthesis
MSRSDEAGAPAMDVVIVTPTYISSNPRVVKEADALAGAGFRVCVVFSQGPMGWARAEDAIVARGQAWEARPMAWSPSAPGERRRYAWSTLRFHFARRVPRWAFGSFPVAVRAECRTVIELARAAAAIRARLYIAHYPEGLAAAAWAAKRHHASLAYDAEDLHTAEDAPTRFGLDRSRRVDTIERRHIRSCAYVSAVSRGVGAALADRYPGVDPIVVHYAFPWGDRGATDGQTKDRKGPATSLYWQSQVIGLDRGLQDVIRALGRVDRSCQLHIRGWHSPAVANQLNTLAREAGVLDRLFLHARVPSGELLSRAVEHDIGLALEQPISRNKVLTASNKIFFYLLAGLAVVATGTPGHEAVLEQAPGAGDVYRPGDVEQLARILERLIAEPAVLAGRRQAALTAARVRWNWETEQQPLIDAVRAALSPRADGAASRSRPGTRELPTGVRTAIAEHGPAH